MITISQWAGLATNASPYSLPPGATVEQENLQSLTPGRVTPRKGITQLYAGSGEKVVKMFLFQNGPTRRLLYQDSLGRIYSE